MEASPGCDFATLSRSKAFLRAGATHTRPPPSCFRRCCQQGTKAGGALGRPAPSLEALRQSPNCSICCWCAATLCPCSSHCYLLPPAVLCCQVSSCVSIGTSVLLVLLLVLPDVPICNPSQLPLVPTGMQRDSAKAP